MQALEYVQKKFAGQALAGTTVSERFSASLSDAGATIGTALLPTFDRLVGHFGDWLQRMNASGKLTQDVNTGVHLLGIGFHTLEDAISVVDKVTGGFGHTLLLIGEIWAGIKIAAWIGTLEKVAISWGLIQSAAEKAAAAEAAAASVSAAGIATGDLRAAALASEGAGGAGLLSRLVPRGVGGAVGLGVGGLIAGQLAERAIPGQAGQTTGRALEGAGVGAGIGLLVGGPVGAGVGGALGGLVGAVSTFIHSAPTFNQQATTMAHSITALGHAGQIASRDILALQSSIATGRVSRDEAQQALKQAQAQEQATRGTSAHAAAVDRLRAAQLNLRVANESLVVSQEKLTAAQKRQADTQERQRKATAAFAVQLQSIAKQSQTIPGPRGLPFPNADPFGTYIDKLRSLQGELVKTDPKMAKVIANLLAIAQMFGKIPSSKTVKLTLQETLAGTFQLPRIGPGGDLFPRGPRSVPSGPTGPTGPAGKPPVVQWSQFQLTLTEQVLQAKAALTKTTADDVAVAKQIIARIKNLIARGKLDDKALIQALQAEADAQSTIDSAAQARRDAAAKAAAVAKARASTYNVPAALQLAQAKAEAYGKSETAILKKIIAAAQKAINSGGKNWQGLVAAYQTIANARAQLEQDAQQALIPLKLQLALARAQATGGDQTPILRKMKAVLEKALKAAKGNIQKQIDIWTQIGAINQQLGQDISNSYGDYKKASLKWETQGLGLTPAQRRALEARLSQIGPGGTHPMSGTGAAGYIIDPDTGRPIHRNQRRRQGSQYSRSGSGTPTVNANIDLRVYIDGKQVEAVVTKRQQKNNTRRPTQSRGPNAATR
jgi:hypothetical protein